MSRRTDDVEYRIAETREDVEGAVRLVYHNYVEQGYCRLNRFQVHFYLFDVLPETRTLVAIRGDQIIATLTLVFDSPLGLPSNVLYQEELDRLRAAGRRMAEISKLAVSRELGARGMAVLKGLFRLAWLTAARVRGMTEFIIMVEPHHEKFYVKSLLFDRIGDLKPDPEARDAPSILLRLGFDEAEARYRRTFGEEAGASNPYWFFCLAPEVAAVEGAARAVDARLTELHQRLETGRRLAAPSFSERRYIDYRLFSIAFVTDKTCREARARAQKGLFRDEFGAYDRLLAALPPDYAPERRAQIYLEMAEAVWHCGMYERALALSDIARELSLDADFKARCQSAAAVSLHFLRRSAEARERVRAGLALPGVSPLGEAALLRADGRMAVDLVDLDLGRALLGEATERLGHAEDGARTRGLRISLAQDMAILEYRSGNVLAARSALDGVAPLISEELGDTASHFHGTLGRLELLSCRPRAALDLFLRARGMRPANSNLYNAAVDLVCCGESYLSLGNLPEARRTVEQALDLARRSRRQGTVADAVLLSVRLAITEDNLAGAKKMLAEGIRAVGDGAPAKVRAQFALAEAVLAAAAGDWRAARAACIYGCKLTGPEPLANAQMRDQQAEVELLAGNLSLARRLIGELPRPEDLPGYAEHEVSREFLMAALKAGDGDESGAIASLEHAIGLCRAGGCVYEQARGALMVAEALKACNCAERNPRLFPLCRKSIAEACATARLPYISRRLAEMPA